jgi:hypothetical protein
VIAKAYGNTLTGESIMIDKVLPGSSREALSFMFLHWKSLLKMSVLPIAAYIAVFIFQIKTMGRLYRSFGSLTEGPGVNPNFMSSYIQGMALSMVGSLLTMCLFGILFAQIIRFQKTGHAQWLMTDKPSISAGLMTLVYGLGICMLTLLAYLAGIIIFMILTLIITFFASLIFTSSAAAGALAVIFGIIAFFAFVAGLYWFMFRFMAGLPGVALGSSPDFFKDMWPLARGESWGLPLRMLLATVMAYVPIFLVLAIFIGPTWLDMISKMSQPENASNPNMMFPIMADMMDSMLPATLVMTVVYIPFMWFVTLLLGIAFQRFRART